MKALKIILLTCVSVLFVLSAVFLQANTALAGTVFSDGFFGNRLDGSVTKKDLSQFATGLTDSAEAFMPLSAADRKALANGKASAGLKKQVNDFKAVLKDAVTPEWLGKEAPRVAKGLFSYFMGNAKSLPAIDIKPIKGALVDAYVNEFLVSNGKSSKDFDAMIAQIELTSGGFIKNGKVNKAAVDQFMQIGQIMSMDMKRDTARKICEKIGNRQKDGSTSEELYQYTVKAVAADMVSAAGMGDNLNLSTLFNSAYGSKDNPVSGFPAMFKSLRGDVLLLSVIIFVLLLGTIGVIAFRMEQILRWLGVPLIVAGVAGLVMPAFVILLRPQIIQLFAGAADGSQFGLQFLQNWALSYIGGVAIFLLVQCAVYILVGIGLIAGARAIGRRGDSGRSRHGRQGAGSGMMFCRVAAAVILLAAIPFSTMLVGRDVMKHVEKYDQVVKAAAKNKNIDFGEAMIKAMGVKAK